MLYIGLFLVIFVLIWLCLSYKIKNLGLIIAVSILSFFSEYVIISGFLFWFDIFYVIRSLVIMLILNLGILSFLILKNKKVSLDYDKCSVNLPLISVLCIAMLFSIFRFGYWGMGADVGVYQVKAIDLMYNDTFRQKDFEEYQRLDADGQAEYFNAVKGLIGYNIYDERKPTLPIENKISPVSGMYHGIPTYPAILALSGYMFGVENMSMLNIIVYLGMILFMNGLCSNFNLNKAATLLALSITSFSPTIIWLAKSTLTEIFLTFVIVAYLYFITAEDNYFNAFFSVLSIAAFAFVHVSIYTLIPYFIICYIIKYITSEKKSYFTCAIISSAAIITGLTMMLFVSPTYTTNNIVLQFQDRGLIIVNDENCVFMMALLAFVFLLIFALFVYIESFKKYLQIFLSKKVFTNIVRIFCVLFLLVCFSNIFQNWLQNNNLIYSIQTNSLIAFCYLTGIFVLPIVIVLSLKNLYVLLNKPSTLLLFFAFFYCVLFRAAFLSTTVVRYYYHTRYLAEFIPIISILIAILITKKVFSYILTAFSLSIIMPYNLVMFNNSDETYMDWENVLDVVNYIEKNDAVIVDQAYMFTHFLTIKEMTDAHVYPFLQNDIYEQCENLAQGYENIFVLTDASIYSMDERLSVVYSDIVHESQDWQQYRNKFIPLPYQFYENDNHIYLMKYSSEQIKYEIDSSKLIRDGFIQERDFAWSNAEDSEVFIPTFSDDVLYAEIIFPNYIPFAELDLEKYDVDVYLDGDYLDTIDLVKQKSFSFLLNANEYKSGFYLQFHSQLWSPAQIGLSDQRMLGFPFSKVLISNLGDIVEYSFAKRNMQYDGFGNIEKNSFAWTVSEDAFVYCMLESGDYLVDIKCRPIIDLNKLGIETYDVQVYMNNNYIGTMNLGKTDESNKCTLKIPAKNLDFGKNVLSFKSKLWIPVNIGLTDGRQLGFALESIIFSKQ